MKMLSKEDIFTIGVKLIELHPVCGSGRTFTLESLSQYTLTQSTIYIKQLNFLSISAPSGRTILRHGAKHHEHLTQSISSAMNGCQH